MEFHSSEIKVCKEGQIVFQEGEIPNPSTVEVHSCPCCKSKKISIVKDFENHGMDGNGIYWHIFCRNCNLVSTYLPANDFYGPLYYKTVNEAIMKWNNLCRPSGLFGRDCEKESEQK